MTVTVNIEFADKTAIIPFSGEDGEKISYTTNLDSRGSCSFVIFDPNSDTPVVKRAQVTIVDNGTTVFGGFALTRAYKRTTGVGRWITCTGTDWSIVTDERLVGVVDGGNFIGPDPDKNYAGIDPNANSQGDDPTTLRALFLAYVDSPPIDTSTFVFGPYLPFGYLGEHPLYWSRQTLRSAIADLAAVVSANVHWWIDGLKKLHWLDLPFAPDGSGITPGGDLTLMLPAGSSSLPGFVDAPRGFSQTPDGVTTFAPDDDIEATYDDSTAAESAYIAGQTDFIYVPTGTQEIVANGQKMIINVDPVTSGGAGWYPTEGNAPPGTGGRDPNLRQLLVSSDARSLEERNADGARALAWSARSYMRGQLKYTSDVDIYEVGQLLTLDFPDVGPDDMPLVGVWPIVGVTVDYLNAAGLRTSTISFGDAPPARLTQKRPAMISTDKVTVAPRPGNKLVIASDNPAPGPLDSVTVSGQFTDPASLGLKVAGLAVKFAIRYFRPSDAVAFPDNHEWSVAHPDEPIPATCDPQETTLDVHGNWVTIVFFSAEAQKDDICWVDVYVPLP